MTKSLFDTLAQVSKKRYDSMFSNSTVSLGEFLEICKDDEMAYASAAKRLLLAIGEPTLIDTAMDQRLGRIFMNKRIKVYPAFQEFFFGAEDTVQSLVSYLRHADEGLEESKQIPYFLGPVGGGKSSLVEMLKQLMETQPVYVLKAGDEISPVFDNPLSLFNNPQQIKLLEKDFKIPARTIVTRPSPWAMEKLKEFHGDVSKFSVEKVFPSRDYQVCISKIEPGDPNNQDISTLVGKVDIRQLENYAQNHPYAYSYSGGLCRGNRGLTEFAEMFKADIKTLNPLLEATQGHTYKGTENMAGLPYEGIVLAHSNEAEWEKFRNNRTNEAFLDRVFIIKVPYCLRVTEEVKIYEKMLNNSALSQAPCAPDTLRLMASWSCMTRYVEPENSTMWSKLRVYDGENIKDTDPRAKPLQEYYDQAKEVLGAPNEGMKGMSTRFAFKVLSKTFDMDAEEIGANPVHLFYVLENDIDQEHLPKETKEKYIDFIKSLLIPKYMEFLEKELRLAYIESYKEYGQTIFEKYVQYADAWLGDSDFRHPETHEMYDKKALDDELSKIEKPAGIANPKDFRNEVVNFVLRYRADKHVHPRWDAYEKMKTVIEKKMFSATEDIMPIISFGAKSTKDEQRKHEDFISRMLDRGYTKRQVKLLVEWYQRMKKSTT